MVEFDVIIIGAGAAGITAANILKSNNIKTCILEARDRIGGRIHDVKHKEMGDLHLGASWLHHKGRKHILKKILDDNNIKYLNDDSLESSDAMDIYKKSEKLSGKEHDLFSKILTTLPKNIKKLGKQHPKLSVTDVVTLIGKKYDYSKDLINALITRASEHCSMNADVMPAKEFDGWEPNGLFIKDGFGKLMNKLSKNLNIKLNTIVKVIDQSNEKIIIDTSNKRYTCKYIITTIPTGVLKSGQVKFKPDLPVNKKVALKQLNSGNHEKIFLKFPNVFWDKDTEVFQLATTNHRGACTQWYNILLKAENEKILYTNISGPDINYAKKSDNELQKICMANLRIMFGDDIPEPESIYVTRWSLDKYTLGGPYAHPNMKGTMEDLSTIGKPFGKIHFGGVDTSKSETETVEAAMLSGIRTANQILKKIDN